MLVRKLLIRYVVLVVVAGAGASMGVWLYMDLVSRKSVERVAIAICADIANGNTDSLLRSTALKGRPQQVAFLMRYQDLVGRGYTIKIIRNGQGVTLLSDKDVSHIAVVMMDNGVELYLGFRILGNGDVVFVVAGFSQVGDRTYPSGQSPLVCRGSILPEGANQRCQDRMALPAVSKLRGAETGRQHASVLEKSCRTRSARQLLLAENLP